MPTCRESLSIRNMRDQPKKRSFFSPRGVGVLSLGGVVLALLAGGCTSPAEYIRNGFKVGPNYQKPPAPVAQQWLDQGARGINPMPADLSQWWKTFNDPILNSLVETAYRQNLDLRTAGMRILEARAIRNIAAGNLFPQLQEAFGSYSRNQLSLNNANVPDGIPGFKRAFDQWGTGFNLSWEVDFWGRFRRALESTNADLDASIENYDDVLVLLIAEAADAYVRIRTFQTRIQYAQDNIEIQSLLVKRADDRFKRGAASKLDLAQMRSNLTDTQALKEQLDIGLRQANNELCVLLGIPPSNLVEQMGVGPIPETPAAAVVGIPADLIRRRPDIRRAERLVAAQSARIGIATSDLYPHFYINGTMGYQAENLGQLFTTKSFFGNIGPGFSWDILNYGWLLNKVRFEDARFQKEVLTYQNTVLRAGREVEDGLIAFLKSQVRARYLAESAADAKVAVEVVESEIKLLQFDINRAFVTSNFLVGQQDKLAVAHGDIALGLIQVYRALGGGWELRLPDSGGCQPRLGEPLRNDERGMMKDERKTEPAPNRPVELLPPPRLAPINEAPGLKNDKMLP